MKYRLLAPGPNCVPERVLRACSKPIVHHRTKVFEEIFFECKQGLSWLLKTKKAPIILASSGTGAFEAALTNSFNRGDKVICITGGKFADNWYKMSKIFGLNAVEIRPTLGQAVNAQEVLSALKEHPDCKGVILVASETSTGVKNPFIEIGEAVKNMPECIFVVDAVTAMGIFDIRPEEHHIDILVSGSQKGLMLPPGLGIVYLSEKAENKIGALTSSKFYFDLLKEQKAQAKNQTAYTPAISLIYGLEESLKMMKEEGLENIFSRHKKLSMATQKGITALNLELFSKNPTEAITSVYSPNEVSPNAVYKELMNQMNFTIAGGQDELEGKIFRIGHMGYVDELDLISFFGALEIVLKNVGYKNFNYGDSFKVLLPLLNSQDMEKNKQATLNNKIKENSLNSLSCT